jgi:hypothetical protein
MQTQLTKRNKQDTHGTNIKQKKECLNNSLGHPVILKKIGLIAIICLLKISKSLQTEFASQARLAEGQF